MNQRMVTANGGEIVIAEAGVGGRPLLLVHGFTGAKEDFTGYLDRFAALGWHAVAPDLRGHGSSSKPDDEAAYAFPILAADLDGLVSALGWDTAVVLGHSLGGMIVQTWLLEHPERFEALILMDTSHKIPDAIDAEFIAVAQGVVREGGIEILVAISDSGDGPSPLDTAAHQRMIAADPGYADIGRRQTLNTATPAWVGLAGEIAVQPDRLAALHGVSVPTLVIVGAEDFGFAAQSKAMAQAIPGAQLAVIPLGGHSPQFEAPDAWWAAVSGFLATL